MLQGMSISLYSSHAQCFLLSNPLIVLKGWTHCAELPRGWRIRRRLRRTPKQPKLLFVWRIRSRRPGLHSGPKVLLVRADWPYFGQYFRLSPIICNGLLLTFYRETAHQVALQVNGSATGAITPATFPVCYPWRNVVIHY